MSHITLTSIRPLLIVFVAISAFCITGKTWLLSKGVQPDVVIIGNLILFLVSLCAFFITQKSLSKQGGSAFVRGMYGSFMFKFFVLAIAAFVYIMVVKKNVNKPGLIICAALYFIYTAIETRALMKILKQHKNA